MADQPTVHSLALLAEYTHSLDSLPLDLSRNFADLRELDAVLSSSMALITAKINQLTKMIEDRAASPEDRLWLLTEIGDEANRLKLGGEDKIRVASAAADNLRNHKNHLIELLRYLPNFDSSVLNRTTYYPHVTSKSYPPHSVETGRRQRRGGNLGGNRNNDSNNYYPGDPNVQKKKRGGGRDDDVEGGPNRTPRKERIVDMSNGKPRNAGRGGGGGRRYVRFRLWLHCDLTRALSLVPLRRRNLSFLSLPMFNRISRLDNNRAVLAMGRSPLRMVANDQGS
jgi:inhibitor of growth protein 3